MLPWPCTARRTEEKKKGEKGETGKRAKSQLDFYLICFPACFLGSLVSFIGTMRGNLVLMVAFAAAAFATKKNILFIVVRERIRGRTNSEDRERKRAIRL